jgi:hypothetical protein
MEIKELNCETGEEVIRDATPEELAQASKDAAEAQAEAEAVQQAKIKRQSLLNKLGITEEEAKLLLGGN